MPADTMGESATGSDCLAVGTGTDTTSTGDYIIIEGTSNVNLTKKHTIITFLLASGGTCGSSSVSKYCGQKLNPATAKKVNLSVCGKFFDILKNYTNTNFSIFLDCTPPFSVNVVTDGWGDTNSAKVINRGFCLNYRQLPCTNTT